MPLSTAHNQKVIYEVSKTTVGVVFCPTCSGSGSQHDRAYHNRTIESRCRHCGGKGKTEIKHTTTVNLREALTELGIIK